MEKKIIDYYVHKAKKIIEKEFEKQNYENALKGIEICAATLYLSNIKYMDSFLEEMIKKISSKIVINNTTATDNNVVLFYDGFGLSNRGLAEIYLKSLCKIKKIIYVTYKKNESNISPFLAYISKSGGNVSFISSKTKIDSINDLNKVIRQYNPKFVFYYSTPDDVVGTTVLNAYKGSLTRYQINLTDHAFWLGAKAIDYCLEFREYGASVSSKFRNINVDNMIMLPYYPIINDKKFTGYPFLYNENTKFVFSGGSLYKTFSKDNKYYKIIEYLLTNYPDVIFWYAGEGDKTNIDLISKKYPGRVYYTHEREDFFEIIKQCYFYLSTYPVCGGLMFQYVAKAGKIPLTLRYDAITDDFLLNQKNLGIQFDNYSELIAELDKIMNDETYVKTKGAEVYNSVIDEEHFDEAIEDLLLNNKTCFQFDVKDIDTDSFRKEYISNFNYSKVWNIIAKPRYMFLIKYFPKEYFTGIIYKIIKKIKGKFSAKL